MNATYQFSIGAIRTAANEIPHESRLELLTGTIKQVRDEAAVQLVDRIAAAVQAGLEVPAGTLSVKLYRTAEVELA